MGVSVTGQNLTKLMDCPFNLIDCLFNYSDRGWKGKIEKYFGKKLVLQLGIEPVQCTNH